VSRPTDLSYRTTDTISLGGYLVWGSAASTPATYGDLAHSHALQFDGGVDFVSATLSPPLAIVREAGLDFSGLTIGDEVWVGWTSINPISGTSINGVASAGLAVA
jgi:hypothetical protein